MSGGKSHPSNIYTRIGMGRNPAFPDRILAARMGRTCGREGASHGEKPSRVSSLPPPPLTNWNVMRQCSETRQHFFSLDRCFARAQTRRGWSSHPSERGHRDLRDHAPGRGRDQLRAGRARQAPRHHATPRGPPGTFFRARCLWLRRSFLWQQHEAILMCLFLAGVFVRPRGLHGASQAPPVSRRLLKKGGIVVPQGGCQYATLVEVPAWAAAPASPGGGAATFRAGRRRRAARFGMRPRQDKANQGNKASHTHFAMPISGPELPSFRSGELGRSPQLWTLEARSEVGICHDPGA